MRDARCSLRVFDGHAEPDMSGSLTVAVAPVDELLHRRTALRQYLINVPVGPLHGVEHGLDVRLRDILVKQIAHRVHENHPGPLPLERLLQPFRPQSEVEAGLERMAGHAAKAWRSG